MRKLVFDIETSNIFQEVGSNDPADLDLAVIAVYDSEDDAYYSYLKSELQDLWPLLERADLLIGFNSDHFDLPLLNKYYSGDLTKIKTVDIMKEVQRICGRRLSLENIASSTLGVKKSGNGLEALAWWRDGKVDKVRHYCIDDVRITKDLYEHALKHGKVRYNDRDKGLTEIEIDLKKYEDEGGSAITHTLPF